MITAGLLTLLICFGHNTGMKLPSFQLTNLASWGNLFNGASWSLIGVLFIVLFIAMKGFSQLSGNIVIPMTADCADYEVYRTGRYVPGLMGTLFSFVDKLISSLASTFVALVYAAIGFKDHLPTEETPYSTPILIATLICFIGMPMIGWILNVIAMKFYPLNKEKMEEIQDEIARIKAESQAQKA
jgi:Na+/melibiose symporter-like transporter